MKKAKKVLKTFNVSESLYEKFSDYCKQEGISMSKKVDNFIEEELEKLGLHLEIEKDVNVQTNSEVPNESESHSMEKYC